MSAAREEAQEQLGIFTQWASADPTGKRALLVTQMLLVTARCGREATVAQRQAIRARVDVLKESQGLFDPQEVIDLVCDVMEY